VIADCKLVIKTAECRISCQLIESRYGADGSNDIGSNRNVVSARSMLSVFLFSKLETILHHSTGLDEKYLSCMALMQKGCRYDGSIISETRQGNTPYVF
jgi:hypothetical protein